MDTSVHHPSCYSLFESTAPECMKCGIQADCMKEQEKRLTSTDSEPATQRDNTDKSVQEVTATPQPNHNPKPKQNSNPQRKEETPKNQSPITGDTQFIPEHSRTPLEIPSVGSTIQTTFKGKTYEALIVDDPSNKRGDGRSILFNGTVYRTLTAAAHAISPGINSGSVWEKI